MNFDDWFKKNYPDVELHPWQEKAINEFLYAMYPYQKEGSGKSLATMALRKFTILYGNNYEL